jgi:hypothetical protein
MMLFRSLTLGLLGTCLYFVVARNDVREDVRTRVLRERLVVIDGFGRGDGGAPMAVAPTVAAPPVEIVDVAHGVEATSVLAMIRIGPDEHIAEVNNRVYESEEDLVRAIAVASSNTHYYYSTATPGQFVDLSVVDMSGRARRMLVLLH